MAKTIEEVLEPTPELIQEDLLSGVAADIIIGGQAARLIAHTKAHQDYREAMGRDGELFDWVHGFSDIFVNLMITWWTKIRTTLLQRQPDFPGKHRLLPYGYTIK